MKSFRRGGRGGGGRATTTTTATRTTPNEWHINIVAIIMVPFTVANTYIDFPPCFAICWTLGIIRTGNATIKLAKTKWTILWLVWTNKANMGIWFHNIVYYDYHCGIPCWFNIVECFTSENWCHFSFICVNKCHHPSKFRLWNRW